MMFMEVDPESAALPSIEKIKERLVRKED